MIRRLTCFVALACLLAMTAAATAAADVRYAEPGGNGAPADCFQSDPCDLEVATSFTYTENGDEVIVLPGVHNMGSTSIFIQDNIDVHGVGALAQETRIVSTANNAVHLQGLGAKLRNVQVEGSGISAAVYMSGGVLDRVVALSSDGYGCLLPAVGVISNSMCISTFATFGVGLSYQNTSSGVRNASIRGSLMIGPAGGLHASTSFSGADSTIDVKSSIIAATDGGFDVLANAAHASSSLDIVIDHSNFDNAAVLPSSPGLDTVTSPGTNFNQTAAPLFVNAAANDFHQTASSPTIDAGAVDGLSGLFDLDGDARSNGNAPDIGPDEFFQAPPAGPTPPAADTTAPVTKIKKRPKKKSKVRKAKFVFSVTEQGLKFKCKLDKGRYRACTSRFSKTVKRGKHKLSVIATDAAGNSDKTPATYRWTVL